MIPALVTAWRNLSAYPAAHPARAAALRVAHQKLTALLATSAPLTLGVLKDALLHDEKRHDSPHVRALAQALHRLGIATLRLDVGVEPAEIEALLRGLGDARDPTFRASLPDALRDAGVTRIAVTQLDYASLAVVDGAEVRPRETANLFEEIVRSLAAGRELAADGIDPTASGRSARAIAELLARAAAAPAGEGAAALPEAKAVAGAISELLGATKGRDRQLVLEQIGELARELPAPQRAPVVDAALRMLASDPSADADLDRLVASLAPDEILASLRRVSHEGGKLSRHALGIAHALSTVAAREHAEHTPSGSRSSQQAAAELGAIFRDEDIDRFNPEDHQALLEQAVSIDLARVAQTGVGVMDPGERAASLAEEQLETTLLATLLDVLAHTPQSADALLPRIQEIFSRSLAKGRARLALEIVDDVGGQARAPGVEEAERRRLVAFLDRLPETREVASLIGSLGRLDAEALGRATELLSRLGTGVARSLLQALQAEPDAVRRRQLLVALVPFGAALTPEIRKLLGDDRWFVVRNMLLLLRAIGDRSALPDIRGLAEHPDVRVRLEAIKSLLLFGEDPSDLLEQAILSRDPTLAESAIVLCGQHGIMEAREPLLRILKPLDFFGKNHMLRLKALRALADLADPSVLPYLDHFFKNRLLPLLSIEERRTAFHLLEAYPDEDRRPIVTRGLRSRDPVIRDTCRRLEGVHTQTQRPTAAASFDQLSGPADGRRRPGMPQAAARAAAR
jgi:HEAT repeat protein